MYIKSIMIAMLGLLFLTGCADKNKPDDSFNKPAAYWYDEMIQNVTNGDLDKADDAYTSLSSEHVASPLLEEALLILAHAHSDNEEHVMAKFYVDTYIKRYAKSSNVEYLKYLKLKSNFAALKKAKRDQKLILDTIAEANDYLAKYPNASYNPLVHTMLTKLYLADLALNRDIASLYRKTGKTDAAKIYEGKIASSWLKDTDMGESDQGFIGKVFE